MCTNVSQTESGAHGRGEAEASCFAYDRSFISDVDRLRLHAIGDLQRSTERATEVPAA